MFSKRLLRAIGSLSLMMGLCGVIEFSTSAASAQDLTIRRDNTGMRRFHRRTLAVPTRPLRTRTTVTPLRTDEVPVVVEQPIRTTAPVIVSDTVITPFTDRIAKNRYLFYERWQRAASPKRPGLGSGYNQVY